MHGGERVEVVESYKYLGCIVNEHMHCREMVRERATAGRGDVKHFLMRCKALNREREELMEKMKKVCRDRIG